MSFPLLFLMYFVVFTCVTGGTLVTCHSIDAFVSCCVNMFLMHTLLHIVCQVVDVNSKGLSIFTFYVSKCWLRLDLAHITCFM